MLRDNPSLRRTDDNARERHIHDQDVGGERDSRNRGGSKITRATVSRLFEGDLEGEGNVECGSISLTRPRQRAAEGALMPTRDDRARSIKMP
jgi:hypothetical protein